MDPTETNNDGSSPESQVITAVGEEADIVVTVSGPAQVEPGAHYQHEVIARNAGPSAAIDIVVTDTLPEAATFVSASGGGTEAAGVVTWPKVSILPVGDGVLHTVDLIAPETGAMLAVGAAASTMPDPVPENNDGSADASRLVTTLALRVTLSATSWVDSATAGSVGTLVDSAAVALAGTDCEAASWTASVENAPWLTLVESSGTGTGVVQWEIDIAALRAGSHSATIDVKLSDELQESVELTVVLTPPTVDLTTAVEQLLGTGGLNEVQRRYLDQEGNRNEAYDLGDLLALLDRSGGTIPPTLLLQTEERP